MVDDSGASRARARGTRGRTSTGNDPYLTGRGGGLPDTSVNARGTIALKRPAP